MSSEQHSSPAPAVITDPADQATRDQRSRLGGLGKVLISVYLVLALAASFRSLFQIIRKFDEAPVAFSLSALAALVYILATVALMRRSGAWRIVAWVAISFELVGVLVVGILSLTHPEWFAHASVWGHFGSDYLFIPLVLPILGLIWLRREDQAGQG